MKDLADRYLKVVTEALSVLTPKLKPCAHCGSKAEGRVGDIARLIVVCTKLNCRSCMYETYIDDISPERACQALEKRWNRRKP